MLSANTAWLVTNDVKKPMDDAQFRLAIANAVNVPAIVNKVYGNIVKAADPTGLLPTWDKYIDKTQTASLGFKYDPKKAAALLAAAGYKKGSDGFVTNKDGSPIKLTIMVPSGWSDWEAARDVIVSSLKAVGINTEAKIVDYNGLVAARNAGDFDLASTTRSRSRTRRGPTTTTCSASRSSLARPEPELRPVHERRRLDPGPAAGQDAGHRHRDHAEDHLAAPEDLPHRDAGHPALVQRRSGRR